MKKILLGFLVLGTFGFAQIRSNTNALSQAQTTLSSTQENRGQTNSDPQPEMVHQSPFDAVKGKKEDQNKRDAFSKHYINEDGSFTALIGAGPIHYEKNGQFLDIDHKIVQNPNADFPFVNATNLMESYFGASSHTGIKNKTTEGEVKEFLNTKMYWEVNGQAVGTVNSANVPVSIVNDKAYYNNLYGNIAAEFAVLTGKRELNYIINAKQDLGEIPANADYLVFSEDVVLPMGWTHAMTEDGILIKNQFGKEMYLYENPTSTDENSTMEFISNTIFETSSIGNTLTIQTKVKTSWLLSNERVFPVMVDPTANAIANGGRSVYDTNAYTSNLGYFGRNNDGYTAFWLQYHIKFNTSTIPQNSIINSTSGYIYIYQLSGTTHNNNKWNWAKSADPTTTSGTTLYNSGNDSNGRLSNSISISSNHGGWNNIQFITGVPLDYVKDGIDNLGYIAATVRPDGTYDIKNMYVAKTHNDTEKPYLSITYTEPITDRTLTVSGAGDTGATPANGTHTYTNNTSVTATSGTRAGYIVTGWTGTGSVPATGTGGTATFNITENSTITWQWEQTETPKDVVFHNYGGTEQLAFNNSRINTNQPVFRLSHGGTYAATDYEIQISTMPNFTGGTSWTQIFTEANNVNTERNFTFTNGFSPVNNTTYYVRARVRGAANVWSAWTTETYSFTYQSDQEIPSWFQTTQAQFETDELGNVVINANNGGEVVTGAGGNLIVNGDFTSGNTNGWTLTGNNSTGKVVAVYGNAHTNYPGNWLGIGSGNTVFYPADGTIVVSQAIDLTNVSQITFNGGAYHYGSGSYPAPNTKLEFKIGGTLTDTNGTIEATLTQGSNNRQDKTVNVSSYTGVQVIKFVMTYNSNWSGNGMARFYIDDVVANAPPVGTITSTPIHFASVQDATGYDTFEWNQTPGSGDLKFDIQGSSDGITFTNISGFTDIQESGSGLQSLDISGIDPGTYPHIRLVGTLNGQNVVLHDWAIEFKKDIPDDCKITTTWNGIDWSHGYPTESPKKQVVFEADYTFDSDEIMYACEVTIDDEVLVSANSSLLVDEFVMVSEDGWLVIESGGTVEVDDEFLTEGIVEVGGDLIVHGAVINYEEDPEYFVIWDGGNLVQINDDAVNEGEITVERDFNFSAERKQYNFIISPVEGQTIKTIYPGNPRVIEYVEGQNWFVEAGLGVYVPGKGYSIREVAGPGVETVTATLKGKPANGVIAFTLKYDSHPNQQEGADDKGYNLVGNPYPSSLDLEQLYAANATNMEPTFQFWDNRGNTQYIQNGSEYNGANYAQYNALNSTGVTAGGKAATGVTGDVRLPNHLARVGTAFMIRALEVGKDKDLVFKNEYRSASNENSPEFFGKNNEINLQKDRYWLTLTTPTNISLMNAVVYFENGNDAYSMDDSDSNGSSDDLYTLVDEHQIAIQGKSSFVVNDTIVLGYRAFETGEHRIDIFDQEGVFANGQNIYLIDRDLDIIHNLSEGTYTFRTEAGEFNDRFTIVYEEDEVLSTIDFANGDIQVYRQDKITVIRSLKQDLRELKIFNLNGQLLLHEEQLSGKYYHLPEGRLGKQVLLLNAKTADGKVHSFKILTH